jgi:hypothetical protein
MFAVLSLNLDAPALVRAVSVSEQMFESHGFDEGVPAQYVKKAEHDQICVGGENELCSSDTVYPWMTSEAVPIFERCGNGSRALQ